MVREITRDELRELIGKEDVQIVDVRAKEFYEKAHIPSAINISLEEIDERIDEFDRNKLIVVYCGSFECQRSPKAARKLERLGFNVVDYAGGISDWREKYEVE